MTHGFDISTAIKSSVDKILQIDLPLIQVTDSKSLYDCLVRLGSMQEKRLMIDVMCLRQAYERVKIIATRSRIVSQMDARLMVFNKFLMMCSR
jgi:hypothetical protein